MRLNVHLISSRYDDEWSTWRETSSGSAGKEETLELASGEEITSISGFTFNSVGWTNSLQAETSAGRSWGPYGTHQPFVDFSLRSSPATNLGLKLNYISGNETKDKYILRWLHQYNQMKTLNVYSWEGCATNMWEI